MVCGIYQLNLPMTSRCQSVDAAAAAAADDAGRMTSSLSRMTSLDCQQTHTDAACTHAHVDARKR